MGQLGLGVAMKRKEAKRPIPVTERVGVDFPRFFTARQESGKTPYDDAVIGSKNGVGNQPLASS